MKARKKMVTSHWMRWAGIRYVTYMQKVRANEAPSYVKPPLIS